MKLRSLASKFANPILSAIANRLPPPQRSAQNDYAFQAALMSAARAVAADQDLNVVLPVDFSQPDIAKNAVKTGLFGNIANNAYNFSRCLRRLHHDTELVIEDGWFDQFLLNRPFWEDVSVRCSSFEEGLASEAEWRSPAFIRRVAYDEDLQMQFQGRFSAIPEIQQLYEDTFAIKLPEDKALLLAQHMGHWPYLQAMKRYDVIQFSGAPISLGIFCPKPYVVFPTGSDLFISPFQDTLFGLMMRAGYRYAKHYLLCETNYAMYLHRLNPSAEYDFAPLMIDTEVHAPGPSNDITQRWIQLLGGQKFILNVCRQSWQWKGNDRLIRAFSQLAHQAEQFADWRLILLEWGTDVDKTKQLISELNLEHKVLWEPLSSKPALRDLQRAADLVADQFVMQGYGTSVLESMALAKPVLMVPFEEMHNSTFTEKPPFIEARSVEEIKLALLRCTNDAFLKQAGERSLQWLTQHHGYLNTSTLYASAYRQVSCA